MLREKAYCSLQTASRRALLPLHGKCGINAPMVAGFLLPTLPASMPRKVEWSQVQGTDPRHISCSLQWQQWKNSGKATAIQT